MESRTGCDTPLSSPGEVGYLRTFTHIKQRRADTGRPLSPLPQQARLLISPEEHATNRGCLSCGHHLHCSLKEKLAGLHSSSSSFFAFCSCLDELKPTVEPK